MMFQPGENQHESAPPVINWDQLGNSHLVHWYTDDASLTDKVAAFIAAGFPRGEAALLLATPEHRSGIEDILMRSGIKLDELQRAGRYFPLDAHETLASICRNGRPNRDLFFEVIGTRISRASTSCFGVRAFGELVNILWERGQHQAALELEGFWNELGRKYPMALFCGYCHHAGPGPDLRFEQICDAHSAVII